MIGIRGRSHEAVSRFSFSVLDQALVEVVGFPPLPGVREVEALVEEVRLQRACLSLLF